MSNHFHLLVATPKSNLSEFMRHFNISYTAAYNRRHRRVGRLSTKADTKPYWWTSTAIYWNSAAMFI
jgi:REP element-mobilizing transposase RayT